MKNRLKKTMLCCALTAALSRLSVLTAFAEDGGFASSEIAAGTQNLINDIGTWLIIICGAVGAASAVYCLIRRGMADDVDGKMWTKRCITAVICAVGGTLVGGIIKLISSYYGV